MILMNKIATIFGVSGAGRQFRVDFPVCRIQVRIYKSQGSLIFDFHNKVLFRTNFWRKSSFS